jgi:hypothetical protein
MEAGKEQQHDKSGLCNPINHVAEKSLYKVVLHPKYYNCEAISVREKTPQICVHFCSIFSFNV